MIFAFRKTLKDKGKKQDGFVVTALSNWSLIKILKGKAGQLFSVKKSHTKTKDQE